MDLSECRNYLYALLTVCVLVLVLLGVPTWLSAWWRGEGFTEYQNQRAQEIVDRAGDVLHKDSMTYSKYCNAMDGVCEPVEYHDARDLAKKQALTKEALAGMLPNVG